MKIKLIAPILAAVVVTVAGIGASQAQAVENQSSYPTIVERLVQKFGLSETEVRSVFDEHRTARQAEMKMKRTQQLDKLVSEGKITAEQKQKLQTKLDEFADQRVEQQESFQKLTPQEKRAQMDKRHLELEAWAKENGIDSSILPVGLGKNLSLGEGMHRGR